MEELESKRETAAMMSAKGMSAPAIGKAIGRSADRVRDYLKEPEVQLRMREYERENLERIRARQNEFVEKIFNAQEESIKTLHEIVVSRGEVRCKWCQTVIEIKCPKCGRRVNATIGTREQVSACKTVVDSAVQLMRVQSGDIETPAVPKLSIEFRKIEGREQEE